MKKLLLSWATAYVARWIKQHQNMELPVEYDGNLYGLMLYEKPRLQSQFLDEAATAGGLVKSEPEPERAGRVVTMADPPAWSPNQRGRGVIVAEPTAVANERKLKERK